MFVDEVPFIVFKNCILFKQVETVANHLYSSVFNISDDGRLHRLPTELSEDEMVEAVQNAMNKASSHMEDSVLASYFALLIGCLLLQNEVYFPFCQIFYFL